MIQARQTPISCKVGVNFLCAIALCSSAAVSAAENAPSPASATKAPAALEDVTTPSGLHYASLREGTGAHPAANDFVKVHYRGTLADGREFDSSYRRNEPASFALDHVIACWTEGVQRMRVGGKAKLTCPPNIAYGARGAGSAVPPNATLTFEVELLSIFGR